MIARVTDELKNATYRVDLTAEGAILHTDPNTVKAVIDCLESHHKLTHETLKLPLGTANPRSKSSATNPRFPSDGFKDEDDSYEPLVHLLNKVIDAANQCMSASHLSGLRFHHFGKGYGIVKGLELDGVGIIGELPTGTEELSWEDIEVIVESKRTVRQMVHQSGMYTRFCLLNNLRRFFALGIGLHFTTSDVYVFVFHRSGFSSSRPLKLTTEEGFTGLVRHVVGILSFKGEAAYGLDTTRTQNMFCINDRYYEIVRPLYMRGSPGRSTVVHSLSGMYPCRFECRTSLMYHMPSKH
jgi:Fungal protein kinase